MDVKVLGQGCANCKKHHEVVEQAIAQTGVAASLTKIEDCQAIMRYGVLLTPAINEAALSAGHLPDVAEVSTWLTTAAMQEQREV